MKINAKSFLILQRIDAYIKEYNIRGRMLPNAASDVCDGAYFNEEIYPLIRSRLLTIIEDEERYAGDECGSSWTVHLTPKAIGIFWPLRTA